jgi:hypothetical protein
VGAAADKTTYSWAATPGATAYDALHGLLSALPVGPGGGDEACFPNLPGPTFVESTTPAPGTGLYILVRAERLRQCRNWVEERNSANFACP